MPVVALVRNPQILCSLHAWECRGGESPPLGLGVRLARSRTVDQGSGGILQAMGLLVAEEALLATAAG